MKCPECDADLTIPLMLLLEKLFLVVIVEPTMKSLKKMVLQLKSKKPKQ